MYEIIGHRKAAQILQVHPATIMRHLVLNEHVSVPHKPKLIEHKSKNRKAWAWTDQRHLERWWSGQVDRMPAVQRKRYRRDPELLAVVRRMAGNSAYVNLLEVMQRENMEINDDSVRQALSMVLALGFANWPEQETK